MKKLICIISAVAIVVSMFAVCLYAAADTVTYRLQFTEKELTYSDTVGGWVKNSADTVATNYIGYSYISTDGAAAIRKFVAPKDGNYKAQNWGSGVWVDNTSGLYTGATFQFAVTDKNGDIVYPTNGDTATVTEGTALNEMIDFGSLSAGDALYFVAMNPSVDNLPIVISYAFRTDDGTEYHNSGRLYGGNTQGANGWYQMYADSVTKVDPATLLPKTYALEFETNPMTWSNTYSAWSADGTSAALIYPDATYGTTDNSLVAIRQFVMPEDGDIRLAWGLGAYTSTGTAKFAITDKTGKIIYPADGPATLSTTPHLIDTTLAGLKKNDAVYLVTWDYSDAGAKVNIHTAFNVNNVSYAYNGCYPYGDNTAQGTNGWYQVFATSVTEVTEADYRDLSSLKAAIAEAEAISDLSAYTDSSVASFNSALSAAKAITKANSQTEIDAAATNLKNAVSGLTLKPVVPDDTVAFAFTENLMTYDSANNRWTAGEGKGSTIHAPFSELNDDNSALAIRKFVAPEAGALKLAWGLGASVNVGKAKFAIADKYKEIIYGPVDLTAGTAHTFDIDINDVKKDDAFYFIVYDATVDGACGSIHTAVNLNYVSYADNGNLWSSDNVQGANGFYYIYADNFKAISEDDYKNLDELSEQIKNAEAITEKTLNKCSDDSRTAFENALAKAKSITKANSQPEIDAAADALKAAIKGLVPKPTASNVKSVTFTEEKMVYDKNLLQWKAKDDSSCIIGPALNISASVSGSGKVAVRKLNIPSDGDVTFKWGSGVFIDNSSGKYTGATAEFIIADKNGNIIFPAGGGAAKITEGTPMVIDFEYKNAKRGDSFYFITLNPSVENLPVIYNFGVSVGTKALQNDSGNLYGIGGIQGAKNWYYLAVSELNFSTKAASGVVEDSNPDKDTTENSGQGGTAVPGTGDNASPIAAIITVISAGACLLTLNFIRVPRGKHQR